jgi:hypothetical protein
MPGTRKLPCPVDEPSEGVLLNVKLMKLVGLGITVRGSVTWPCDGHCKARLGEGRLPGISAAIAMCRNLCNR